MESERIAVVTGAARGIGLATARLLAADGARVRMLDIDGEELARAVGEVPGATAHACDVGDPDAVAAFAADCPRVDALVNNAGLADFGPIEDTTFERWRAVMRTNLDGPFLVTQALLPALKAARGAVVNIASISALRASTLRVAYGTSKAGIAHLAAQQAVELGEHGIRVNCVCPGPVRTKLAMAVHTPDIIDAYHDAIPLGRYGNETEIAEAIRWLLSPAASFVTGQRLAVDGGFEATGIGLPALRDGRRGATD
ncbi:SDR family NAD(P)-dependent oxidoreductase [Jannaschia sp. W003]|uniref:SDR family NAD(P)-dependent oxidoreductase n=1 Tax=Jannaschia sp. W003 TaxID=2867012 RepID=UPI0021A5490F|nr:SDR family oxidoreductase [Jannaschia sp. W003]UWQ20710.1 SDR family oxidoreductase [Jannaschia sp. W003]